MDERRSGEDRRINGSPVCPSCGEPKDARSHTCRACAVARGAYRTATKLAASESTKRRLQLMILQRGWSAEQAKFYLAGWRAGRHAAHSEHARSK